MKTASKELNELFVKLNRLSYGEKTKKSTPIELQSAAKDVQLAAVELAAVLENYRKSQLETLHPTYKKIQREMQEAQSRGEEYQWGWNDKHVAEAYVALTAAGRKNNVTPQQ